MVQMNQYFLLIAHMNTFVRSGSIKTDLGKMMDEPHKAEQEVFKLEESSVQFKTLSEHVMRTIGRKGNRGDLDIVDIFQIKNTSFEDAFYGNLTEEERELTTSVKNILFHGTSKVAVESIIKNQFDVNAAPSEIKSDGKTRSKKGVYGKGIYLTNYSATALDYGRNIICCKVILRRCETLFHLDNMANCDIPATYDSRRVTRQDDEIFIVKDPDHILPQYVITFGKPSIISQEKRNLTRTIEEIRSALSANSKRIQEHHFTSMYLGYIDMIEKKEELNKNAPSEDIKGNVMKIYTEVVRFGMLFSSPGFIFLRYISPSLLPDSVPASWEDGKFIIARVRTLLEEATSRKNGVVCQHIVDRVYSLIERMKMTSFWMAVNLDTDVWWINKQFK